MKTLQEKQKEDDAKQLIIIERNKAFVAKCDKITADLEKITKMLAIITCFVISVGCFGQIVPHVEVEGGYSSNQYAIVLQRINFQDCISSDVEKYPIYSNVKLGFTYKKFTFKQNIENWMGYTPGNTTFNVKQITFTTGFYYELPLGITAGYEHMCLHPLINDPILQYTSNTVFYRASYDKLFIKIKIL